MALMRIAVWCAVKADVGSNHYIRLRNGQFIGEMSYVSDNPGSGTVLAEEDSLLVEWPRRYDKGPA